MQEGSPMDRSVRAGLEMLGFEADPAELAVIGSLDAIFGPAQRALLGADLAGIAPEPCLDPSRAPDPAPGGDSGEHR
jgi:hypothetical protein